MLMPPRVDPGPRVIRVRRVLGSRDRRRRHPSIENQESRSDGSEGGRRSDASAQDGDEDPGENENRAGPDLRSRAAVTAPRVSASSRRRERASGSLGRARSGEIQYSSGRSGSEEWDERPR